jgi:hypothetical protein
MSAYHRLEKSDPDQLSKCIWCGKRSSSLDIEHVFPAALGCPNHFVLAGNMVCRRCNNKLSKLDLAVCDEFDLIAFFSGVPRRGGKSPQVLNRGNFIATIESTGPKISINMNPKPRASHTNVQLGPYGGSQRNIKAKFVVNGNEAIISGSAIFGQGKKFPRGLVKIAFSCLAYHLGGEVASSKAFDPVRNFVLHGNGSRHVLAVKADDDAFLLEIGFPYIDSHGNCSISFRIACVYFYVDFSPDEALYAKAKAKAEDLYGMDRLSVFPNNNI